MYFNNIIFFFKIYYEYLWIDLYLFFLTSDCPIVQTAIRAYPYSKTFTKYWNTRINSDNTIYPFSTEKAWLNNTAEYIINFNETTTDTTEIIPLWHVAAFRTWYIHHNVFCNCYVHSLESPDNYSYIEKK